MDFVSFITDLDYVMKSVHEEVPYSGDMGAIRDFYDVLGIEVTSIGVRFSSFELIYVDEKSSIDGSVLSVEIDGDLGEVEKRFEKMGVKPLRSGFDTGGPFIVVADPAGKKVRISFSMEALARSARKSANQDTHESSGDSR